MVILAVLFFVLVQRMHAFEGCFVRYGRRSCNHESVNGVVASCDGRNVEELVPQNLPNDLVYLSLSNFRFRRLQSANFSKFTTVQCLTLVGSTELREVHPATFSDLTQLRELKLDGTRLNSSQLAFLSRQGTDYRLLALSNSPTLHDAGETSCTHKMCDRPIYTRLVK